MSSDVSSSEVKMDLDSDDAEECTVCRGKLIDPTRLDSCTHIFCFACISQWLKSGPTASCPMCKSAVSRIIHNLDKNVPDEVDISDVRPTVQAVPVEHTNMQFEKRVISYKCRECRRRMMEMDELIAHKIGDISTAEINKRTAVSLLNSLQMIKDDIRTGSPKSMVVSKPDFRKIIYTDSLQVCHGELPNVRVSNGKDFQRKFLEGDEDFKNAVIDFIKEEFKSIPGKDTLEIQWPTEYVHDILSGTDEETAQEVYEIFKCHIFSTAACGTALTTVIPATRYMISIFINQLRWFIDSDADFYGFCGKIEYRLPTERRVARQNRNEDQNEEVVVISDNDSEPAEDDIVVMESIAPRRNHQIIRNGGQMLLTPFTNSILGQGIFAHGLWAGHPSMELFGPWPGSSTSRTRRNQVSSSDTDEDSSIYRREQLRVFPPEQQQQGRRQSPIVIDDTTPTTNYSNGDNCSWRHLTSSYINRGRREDQEEDDGDDQVVVISDEEGDDGEQEEDEEEEETQRRDETIVLNDTIAPEPSSSSTTHTRRSHDDRKSSRRSREERRETRIHREDGKEPPRELVDRMKSLLDEYGYKERREFKVFKHAAEKAIEKVKREKRDQEMANSTPQKLVANVEEMRLSQSPATAKNKSEERLSSKRKIVKDKDEQGPSSHVKERRIV